MPLHEFLCGHDYHYCFYGPIYGSTYVSGTFSLRSTKASRASLSKSMFFGRKTIIEDLGNRPGLGFYAKHEREPKALKMKRLGLAFARTAWRALLHHVLV